MSITKRFFGAWYADAMPSGEWAVLIPMSHIESHVGRIPLPPNDEPLYQRITNIDGFRIAGQAHHSGVTWEWIGGMWKQRTTACGVSPVIYDRLGLLHISDCSIGTQGFRFCEDDGSPTGWLWTGDQTYAPQFGLYEWSRYKGIYIGQGGDGGVGVFDSTDPKAVMRVLEPGDCRFVRVQGEEEDVAIAFVKPTETVVVFTTLAELRALPPMYPPNPEPPNPEPPPVDAPPVITIVSYLPTSGPTPLTVRATWATEPGSGPVTQLTWQARADDGSHWLTHGTRPPSVATFDYVFTAPGTYDLRLVATGPGGEAATGAQRRVTATSTTPVPPNPEPPKELLMVAYGSLMPGFLPADIVQNEDGTVSLKKPNGKFVAVTPGGTIEERDTPGGAWESFQQTPTALLAWREQREPNDTVYVLPLVGA